MPIIECGFPAGLTGLSPTDALALRGPTVLVDIGFDPAIFGQNLPQVPATASALAVIPAVQVPALIDTGASDSSIDEKLAQQLQLPLIDQEQCSGIGGTIILNILFGTHCNSHDFNGVRQVYWSPLASRRAAPPSSDRSNAAERRSTGLRWPHRSGQTCPVTNLSRFPAPNSKSSRARGPGQLTGFEPVW
jgi:hypothetical protein